jgi:urease accessory protein
MNEGLHYFYHALSIGAGLIFLSKPDGKEVVRFFESVPPSRNGSLAIPLMTYVHHVIEAIPANLTRVPLGVDRHTLSKRRWRGVAADGRSFSFVLEEPIVHGAVFHASKTSFYVIIQEPERIVEVPLGSPASAARMAWLFGSHHFPVEVKNGTIRLADSAAVRKLFAREHICFKERKAVFQPFKAAE